jgi:hypothetical protein
MHVSTPTDDDITALSRQLGVSRRDLEAFVEAWNRAGRREPLVDFLGVIPEQRSADDGPDAAGSSRSA